MVSAVSGRLSVGGHEICAGLDDDAVFAVPRDVGMVFQNPDNQIVANVVREDVAFGLENLGVPHEDMIPRIDAALAEVRNGPARAVPDHLRDRHRPGSENYGAYRYPHSYPSGWVEQRYLPDGLERGCFYRSSDRGWEAYRADSFARDPASSATASEDGENPTSQER